MTLEFLDTVPGVRPLAVVLLESGVDGLAESKDIEKRLDCDKLLVLNSDVLSTDLWDRPIWVRPMDAERVPENY